MAIAWLPSIWAPTRSAASPSMIGLIRAPGDAERDREVDVAAAEGVDEGVDRAVGGSADALLRPSP